LSYRGKELFSSQKGSEELLAPPSFFYSAALRLFLRENLPESKTKIYLYLVPLFRKCGAAISCPPLDFMPRTMNNVHLICL
jgi:hypothetical protein